MIRSALRREDVVDEGPVHNKTCQKIQSAMVESVKRTRYKEVRPCLVAIKSAGTMLKLRVAMAVGCVGYDIQNQRRLRN